MAITFTSLEHTSSSTDANTYTTGSVVVPASRLVLLFVSTPSINTVPTSIAGTLGFTWTEVTNVSNTGATRKNTVYRANSGAGATGTVVINLGGTATGCQWSIVSVAGSQIGSGGVDGVVQAGTPQASASATSLSVPMAAFADPVNNGVIAWFNVMKEPTTWTPLTGTQLSAASIVTPAQATMCESGTGEDTSVSASWNGAGNACEAIALEIAVAVAGGSSIPVVMHHLRQMEV